jgi:filamentous hemagglutinin
MILQRAVCQGWGSTGRRWSSRLSATNGTWFPNQLPDHPDDLPRQVFTAKQVMAMKGRRLNYVVTEDGRLIIGRKDTRAGMGGGHIDLAGGRPIRAAGEVIIRDGKIKYFDNASGHYEPKGPSARHEAEEAFKKAGFDVEGKYIEKRFHPEKGWIPVEDK